MRVTVSLKLTTMVPHGTQRFTYVNELEFILPQVSRSSHHL